MLRCPGGVMFGALTLARMGSVERGMELGAMVPRTFSQALRGEGVRALLASALGDHEGASTLAADILSKAEAPWRAPESALAMLEALAALGRWKELKEHVAQVRDFAGALVTLGPTCDRAEGLIRAAAGNLDAAAELFKQVPGGVRPSGRAIRNRPDHGSLGRRHARREGARSPRRSPGAVRGPRGQARR